MFLWRALALLTPGAGWCLLGTAPISRLLLWLTKWWVQRAWKCLAREGGIKEVVYPFYMRIKKGVSQVFVLVLNSCAAGAGFGATAACRCYLSSCPARKLPEMGGHMLQASCRWRGEEVQMQMWAWKQHVQSVSRCWSCLGSTSELNAGSSCLFVSPSSLLAQNAAVRRPEAYGGREGWELQMPSQLCCN